MTLAVAPPLPSADAVGVGLTRDEWLEVRKQGLGGSDIASVLGASPWKSPLQLYLEKTGEIEDEFKETEAIRWGQRLEQPIADEFSETTGIVTFQPEPITIYRSHDLACAQASPDRLGGSPDAVDSWVEIKSVGAHRKDEWIDEETNRYVVPGHYLAQAHWEIAVSGLPRAHVACLLGGQRLIHVVVESDPLFEADLLQRAADFWARIETRKAPPADGSDSTSNVLRRRFAQSEPGSSVELGPELAHLVMELRHAKAESKEAGLYERSIENRIKTLLKSNEVGLAGGRELITWKTSYRKGYSVEPGNVRRLLLGKDA